MSQKRISKEQRNKIKKARKAMRNYLISNNEIPSERFKLVRKAKKENM